MYKIVKLLQVPRRRYGFGCMGPITTTFIHESLMVGLQHSEPQFPHPYVGVDLQHMESAPSECCVAVQDHGGPQTPCLLSMVFGGAIRP